MDPYVFNECKMVMILSGDKLLHLQKAKLETLGIKCFINIF